MANRRHVLRGVAALAGAAVTGLPTIATATTTSPDAALIALAEKAVSLALHRDILWDRRTVLEGRAERIRPRYPQSNETTALLAYDAQQNRIAHRIGLAACRRRQNRLQWRLQNAAADLADMAPVSLAGLAAKARIAVALDPRDEHGCLEWEDDFRAAVLRDAVALVAGGQANG